MNGTSIVTGKSQVANIENYFNTLPPFEFPFKEKIEEGIAEESKHQNIENILAFDNHFEKFGLNVVSE